jgi:hypothetical protein
MNKRAVTVLVLVFVLNPRMELSAQQTAAGFNPTGAEQADKKAGKSKAESATMLDAQHWQLFIDDFAVSRGTGLDRVVHHPKTMGVVIANDKPWESHSALPNHFARKADGTFVGYYTAVWWIPKSDARSSTINDVTYADGVWRTKVTDPRPPDPDQEYVTTACYATSKDGIHWEKPNLGVLDQPTGADWKKYAPFAHPTGVGRDNNALAPFGFMDLALYGNVSDPAKRYAFNIDGRNYFGAELPDLIHDGNWKEKLTLVDGTFSPRGRSLNFWDEQHQEWVAIVQNAVPHWLPTREIARFASPDLKRWTSDIVLTPDSADLHRADYYDEPMSMTAYYQDGVVLGLLSWFHGDRSTPEGGPVLDKSSPEMSGWRQGWPWPATAENPSLWPWARKGTNEMRITLSRDGGRTWDRTASREAWIPHGTQEDNYDRLIMFSAPPVRVEDEDWFYVGVMNGDHLITRTDAHQSTRYTDRVRKGQIAIYTQKHNRFVSLRTKSQMQTLVTRPFVVSGDTLQLNVDATRGRVRVGIAEYKPVRTLKDTTDSVAPHLLEQNVLAGFTREDCIPIDANNVEQVVQFKNGSSLKELQGRDVVLFIEMLDADLYGFRIK